ncbi:MAG: hypothetical protein EBY39_11490, partial [Flavobacteriia bacterium]|nr:hypothetical protein [Flavobacteriia bacterium]
MPPEDQLSEDELNELIEAFKKVNSDLYSQLISLTGANEESLKNFISQLSKNEKLNTESLVKILTATSDSDENLQDYLENFLNGFEKVTSSSSDQLSKIISGFSSQSSMFQKNLERIQAKTNELGKATEQGIGNIHKLMTSLSNTYATMAQVQGTIMQTAVFDSSSMDGRSLEGELLVELSNVSEFDGAINKFQTQITGLSDELLLAGKYISDVQKTRILNTRKELALEQGILEARKLSAAVIQDSNGNFLDLEKSLDKATKLAEEFSKNLREGNSHLNRQINLGKELALAQQQTYSAQYLSGEQISQNVKSLQKISDELLEQETISGKMAYLNEEIAKSQKFQEDNANAVKNAQEDLTNKLEEQKRIQDELATTSDLTRKLELETNLKDVQTDIQGISSLVGEMEASKKMTVQLEAQLRTVGELEESQLRVNEKEIHKLDITGEISELEKANKELERIMTEGTTTSIISNVSGGAQARGTSAITTEQLKVIEQISSKEEVVAHLKDIQRQNLEKIKAHQEEITKTNEQITDEQQHQISLTEKSEGLTKGAAEDTAKNLQNAKKLTEELAKAREEQIKSSTFGVYTDSAIKSLDAIEQKILSATESIPFFGSAIKNHLEKPLRDVKEQISEEFINTFTSVASEIKDISEKEQLLL